MTFLGDLAKALSRTSEETRLIGDAASVRAKYLLIAALAVPLFLVFVPLMAVEVRNWDTGKPQVVVPTAAWRAYYGATTVKSDALWKSPHTRADAEHFDRVRALQGKEFWIGATIEPSLLAQARKLQANQFILGYISATYRIWIDGEFEVGGNYSNTHLPIVLTIPMSRLSEQRPLKIAIQILHDAGSPFPDFLAGHIGEGFATTSSARYYIYKVLFWNETRPWFFFGANILVALLFFFFWSAARKKQEYFYMGMYALIHGVIQVRYIDFVYRSLGYQLSYSSELVLSVYGAGFGMLLGFSFSRARRDVFSWGVPFILLAPIPAAIVTSSAAQKLAVLQMVEQWLAPFLYFAGAMSCVIQSLHLVSSGRSSTYLPVRAKRLLLFAVGLFAMAVLFYAEGGGIASVAEYVVLRRFVHFGLVLMLCGIVVREYREQELLIEKTPVSEYHRRPVLPERVCGALLTVDLKGSEKLFRIGARLGDAGRLVNTCLSFLWTAASGHGGFIIQTEGDQLRAFFPTEAVSDPLVSALKAASDMQSGLKRLARQFQEQGHLPDDGEVSFRGGVAVGEIKPIWQEFGGGRFPAWVEAGHANVFVDSVRLMEAERHLGDSSQCNVVLLEAQVSGAVLAVPDLANGLKVRRRTVESKHERVLEVAVFSPNSLRLSDSTAA